MFYGINYMLFTEKNFVTLCDSSRNRRAALSEATIPRNLYSRCVATAALRWSKDSVEAPGGGEEELGDSLDVSQ